MVQFWSRDPNLRTYISCSSLMPTHKPWIGRNDFRSFSDSTVGNWHTCSWVLWAWRHKHAHCPVFTVIGALSLFHTCECIICHAGEKGYGRNTGLAMCWRGLTSQTLLCDNSSTSMLETCVASETILRRRESPSRLPGVTFFLALEPKLCISQIL